MLVNCPIGIVTGFSLCFAAARHTSIAPGKLRIVSSIFRFSFTCVLFQNKLNIGYTNEVVTLILPWFEYVVCIRAYSQQSSVFSELFSPKFSKCGNVLTHQVTSLSTTFLQQGLIRPQLFEKFGSVLFFVGQAW